ncbi:caspase-10 [Hyla sarda]|uniref:caspase-10 n=1 Tax=Hyla sarda TaxID=327740 RepID=UPI0024C45B8C|nr:caspase-10 [Hyla sarda]XP_056390097.1 caspase-10 [Hyla sarda]XP_056390098.1 caspase-10 [Hyla sarda]
MDFNRQLFSIDSQLAQEDLESLKFLCVDLISNKRLLAIKSSLDLFRELQKQSLLEEDKYDLLAELLYIIGQHSLLRILGTNKWIVQETLKKKRNVSSYRQMLFELYEDITSEDLKSIIFLLDVPKKYSENKKFLDILCYLEKNDQLSETKLDVLEKVLGVVSLELLKIIDDYKKTREIQTAGPQFLSPEDTFYDKTPLSKEVTEVSTEDKEEESIREYFQHVTETVKEKDLMTENTEICISDLNLNEQPKQELDILQVYPMNRKHRGYCLVINNSEFMKSDPRRGTEKDAEFLNNVFTWLGLEVEIRKDMSTLQIHECLKEFQNRDHTERDCFVCCILTHGKSQAVYGSDSEIILLSEVTSYFSSTNCSTLAEKPKLFFIQACQGKSFQGAHAIEADAISSVDEKRDRRTIPDDADILIGMSTVDGYYSFRDIRKGSWYIQALCENLAQMVPRGEDILSILTKVNKDVSDLEYMKYGKTIKQMPQPTYTLRRKIHQNAKCRTFHLIALPVAKTGALRWRLWIQDV